MTFPSSVPRLTFVGMCAIAAAARATGHGPVYGLATPTLPAGAFSLDVGGMYRFVEDGAGSSHAAMVRPMLGYGLTEDLELAVSLPLPLYSRAGQRSSRMMGMMPATSDAEVLLAWRFQRNDRGVGSRIETTALFGLDYPTTPRVNGAETSPGFVAGAVTGYVSRTLYAWAGALYHRSMSPSGPGTDHPGDELLYSVVLGYRPALFRRDLPHADWRFFVEAVGEVFGRDRIRGTAVADSGGHQIFVGPTALGLFGAWGISAGPTFRVYGSVNGAQPEDTVRVVVNSTYWF